MKSPLPHPQPAELDGLNGQTRGSPVEANSKERDDTVVLGSACSRDIRYEFPLCCLHLVSFRRKWGCTYTDEALYLHIYIYECG